MYGKKGLRCVCEVCGRGFVATRSGQKYCGRRCRQWAYDNRKRVTKKQAMYRLTQDESDDLRKIAEVSVLASEVVLRVSSLAGRDLAVEVLDGMWDLLARSGGLVVAKLKD